MQSVWGYYSEWQETNITCSWHKANNQRRKCWTGRKWCVSGQSNNGYVNQYSWGVLVWARFFSILLCTEVRDHIRGQKHSINRVPLVMDLFQHSLKASHTTLNLCTNLFITSDNDPASLWGNAELVLEILFVLYWFSFSPKRRQHINSYNVMYIKLTILVCTKIIISFLHSTSLSDKAKHLNHSTQNQTRTDLRWSGNNTHLQAIIIKPFSYKCH